VPLKDFPPVLQQQYGNLDKNYLLMIN